MARPRTRRTARSLPATTSRRWRKIGKEGRVGVGWAGGFGKLQKLFAGLQYPGCTCVRQQPSVQLQTELKTCVVPCAPCASLPPSLAAETADSTRDAKKKNNSHSPRRITDAFHFLPLRRARGKRNCAAAPTHGVQLLAFLRREAPGRGRDGGGVHEERQDPPQPEGIRLPSAEIAGRLQGCPAGRRDAGSQRLRYCLTAACALSSFWMEKSTGEGITFP